jgi:hypothetical protein
MEMKNLSKLSLLAAAALVCWSGQSSASLRYRNSTPNTLFTLNAFASTEGAGCGFSDGCPGGEGSSFPAGFRVRGWFSVAPGGVATVETHAFHNAKHQGFAQDLLGNVWGGGGSTFCINNEVQNHCGNGCAPGAQRIVSFFHISHTTCCGFWCTPVNFTLNLTL